MVDARSAMAVLDSTITYPVAIDAIEKLAAEYLPLVVDGIDDKAGMFAVKTARQDVKRKRVAVEKRRKELKAGALDYGRKVDAAAKELTEKLLPIENHLKGEEEKIANEKAAIKRHEEEKRKAKFNARVANLKDVGAMMMPDVIEAMSDQEFAATLAGATKEHEQQLAAIAERQRKANELAERQRKIAERLSAEREAIEAERRKVNEEARKIKEERRRIEEEQAKTEAAERAAKEKAEREKKEAEAAALRRQQEEAERQRLEALRPDLEKLQAVADEVLAIKMPAVAEELQDIAMAVRRALDKCAREIRDETRNYNN